MTGFICSRIMLSAISSCSPLVAPMNTRPSSSIEMSAPEAAWISLMRLPLDPRGEHGDLLAWLLDRRLHQVEDHHAGVARLGERVDQHRARDAGELGVELQRRHELARAGDLEVHVAVGVLGS